MISYGLKIFQRKPLALLSFKRTMKVMNLEPKLIKKNHSLQLYYGGEFMKRVQKVRRWGDLKDETLMDIGCGAGNNSTQLLLDHFAEVGKIIATDVSGDIIDLAKKTNKNPKVEFFTADIQDESVHKKWYGSISKIVSMFSLHWVVEQEKAFQNIYNLLQPGGEAALIFVLTSKNYNANKAIYDDPKWKDYFKGTECFVSESQVKHYDAFHYQNLLMEKGFDVLLCEEDPKNYVFQNDEECADFLKSLFPDIERIPDKYQDELGNDLMKANVEFCGRSGDGRPNFKINILNTFLLKPKSFFRERFGTVDKVFSFFVLQWVKDQEQAFKNIFNVLRPGGEAALLMPLRADSFNATEIIRKDFKWKDMFRDVSNFVPLSHTKGFDALYYHKMLSNIGFEVLSCKTQDNVYDHQTRERFKKFLCSICDLTKQVPESKKDEFGEDLISVCKKLSNADDSQNIFKFSCLSVFLRKPITEAL